MKGACVCLLVVMMLGASSCAVRYVPVEQVRVDSLSSTLIQRDSVCVRDSVFVFLKGDTVFKTKYKYVYRDRVVCDTLFRLKCDTLTKVVEIEKSLTRWENLKMNIGGGIVCLAPFVVLLLFFKLKKWK